MDEEFKLFKVTQRKKYYISNQGYIKSLDLRTNTAKKMKCYSNWHTHPQAVVSIDSKKYSLKHLVAQAFIPEYERGKFHIEFKDGVSFNCATDNLILIPVGQKKIEKEKLGSPRSKKSVIVQDKYGNETQYESVRKAALAIGCSYQTLFNFLKGKSVKKKTVGNDGYKIRYASETEGK